MTVCICTSCGAEVPLRSRFEEEGECPECGEATLVAEDAYDPEPRKLVCAACRYEVDGGAPRGADADTRDEFYAGRFSVDDPCPKCGREELDPDPRVAPSVRAAPEYRLAAAAAAELRAKGSLLNGVLDVRALAEAEGLEVVFRTTREQGKLVGQRIEVPADAHPVMQRFAIAHELGHARLRHEVGEDKIEPEANAFASHLLIPRTELRDALQSHPSLTELTRRFQVSRPAMLYALDDIGGWSKVRPADS